MSVNDYSYGTSNPTVDSFIQKMNPALILSGTEMNGGVSEVVEVEGSTWIVANAAYSANSGGFVQQNAARPSNALIINAAGTLQQATALAGAPTPIVWSFSSISAITDSVFNVTTYGATGNGIDDDTVAVQKAYTAAASTGGIVFFPAGTYIISSGIIVSSHVETRGAGRFASTLKTAAVFTPNAGGYNSNAGILNLDDFGVTVSPIIGVGIYDIGFDLTNQSSSHIFAVHQAFRPVQNLVIERVYMTLPATCNGIQLEQLGGGTGEGKDMVFRDIFAKNGGGVVCLYLNATNNASTYHSVLVDNIQSVIDINGVLDDRVNIAANSSDAVGQAVISGIKVSNIFTVVKDSVTSGLVNSVKYNPGINSYVKDIVIDTVFHQGPNGATWPTFAGFPVEGFLSTNVAVQNITVQNIYGNFSGGLHLKWLPKTPSGSFTVRNVRLENCQDPTCGIEFFSGAGNAGNESVFFSDISLHNAAAVVGNLPVGLMFSGTVGKGSGGEIKVQGGLVQAFSYGFANNIQENGTTAALVWGPMYIKDVRFYSNSALYSVADLTLVSFSDCIGINPAGHQTSPTISLTTVALPNPFPFDCTVYITAGAGTCQVQVNGQATNTLPASAVGSYAVRRGQSITLVYATAPTSWTWFGV